MKKTLSQLTDLITDNYAISSVVAQIATPARDTLTYTTCDPRAVQAIGQYARTLGLHSVAVQTEQNGPFTITIRQA